MFPRLIFLFTLFFTLLFAGVHAQTVRVSCETEGAEITDKDGRVVSGSIPLKSGTSKLLRATKEGHRPRSVVATGSPELVRNGFSIDALDPYPVVKDLMHTLSPGSLSFDIPKGAIRLKRYENELRAAKSPDKALFDRSSSDAFESQNQGEASILKEIFNRMKMLDESNQDDEEFFTDYSSELRISAVVESIELTEYSAGGYGVMIVRTRWVIRDYFDGVVTEQSFKSVSNPMPARMGALYYMENTSSSLLGYLPSSIFEDALEEAMVLLLRDEDFRKKLNERKDELAAIGQREIISIRPGSVPSTLSAQRSACVTIKRGEAHGSGCIISPDGYIVTNYHVSGDGQGDTLMVELNSGKTHRATVLRTDPVCDLALLKIEETGLSCLRPERSYNPALGEPVLAIGTPADAALGQTITRGIVSAVRQAHGRDYIQTDANVSPGNSGGALVSASGKFIGVVSSKAFGSVVEGVGFAVPAGYIYERLNIDFN
ncbi:MAG: S1C family serine protease [Flavobacteriales bacterium]